jgi:preprotein translocase subunit YajC
MLRCSCSLVVPYTEEDLLPMESKATKFQKDDRVVVVSGDLNHLTGRVMSIFKDTITIMPDDKDLTVH